MSDDYTSPVHDIEFNHDEPAEHLPASVVFEYLATHPQLLEQHPNRQFFLARRLGLLNRDYEQTLVASLRRERGAQWQSRVSSQMISDAYTQGNDTLLTLDDAVRAVQSAVATPSRATELLGLLYENEGDIQEAFVGCDIARDVMTMSETRFTCVEDIEASIF